MLHSRGTHLVTVNVAHGVHGWPLGIWGGPPGLRPSATTPTVKRRNPCSHMLQSVKETGPRGPLPGAQRP